MQHDTRTREEIAYDLTRLSPAPQLDEEIILAREADRLLAPAQPIDEAIAALQAQIAVTEEYSAKRRLIFQLFDLALHTDKPAPAGPFEAPDYDYDGLIAMLEAAEQPADAEDTALIDLFLEIDGGE